MVEKTAQPFGSDAVAHASLTLPVKLMIGLKEKGLFDDNDLAAILGASIYELQRSPSGTGAIAVIRALSRPAAAD